VALITVRGSANSLTVPVTVQGGSAPQTRLWSGGSKLMSRNPQIFLDVGFTGFIYGTPWLGNPDADAERAAICNSGRDHSNSYLGFYLDSPNAEPPLADWFDDARWETQVLPRIEAVANQARAAGFKGLMFDQELYHPQLNQPATYWTWNYPGNTHDEWTTRIMANLRGRAVAEAVGNLPVLIYNWNFPGMREALTQTSQAALALIPNLVYGNWFDGLATGGLDFELLDNDIYKDFGPHSSFAECIAANKAAIPAAHRSKWEGFIWITNGPFATKAVNAGWTQREIEGLDPIPNDAVFDGNPPADGVTKKSIWDRQRSDAYVLNQVAATRAGNPNMTVYAYNLVGDAAPYEGLL
jgi:hypothetical protein